MNRLEKLSAYIFPSDPAKGYIGSIDLNIWLAQIAGIPLLGLKHESLGLKIILLCYGTLMTIFVTFLYTGFEIYDLILCWRSLDSLTQNTCLSLTHLAGVTKRKAFYRGEFENKLPFAIYATLVSFTGFLGMIMLFYDP
ncbi:uncharacterized protein LOC119663721, partial [Teleopsis dalmanni]|uniref:uncharacterized protein LOC119663721 n=1 Tax=Teleopsis dalmanni TaxID=139649 RepID=UPI0018CEF2BC